jgi:hypothetical protein
VSNTRSSGFRAALIGLMTCGLLAAGAGSALAQTGGSVGPGDPTAPAPAAPTGVPGVATLAPDGSAVPPSDAPPRVVRAIAAANSIRTMPYVWGGGHNRKFFDRRGYDCSGAVSFVLHAAKMIKYPMASGPLAKSWGTPGVGRWITVYANRGHAYAVIAGLRWDTSAVGESLSSGSGPRWRATPRPSTGYWPKHFKNL